MKPVLTFFFAVASVMALSDSLAVTAVATWVFVLGLVLRHFAIQARSLIHPEGTP